MEENLKIVNKVEKSGIITIDLENLIPDVELCAIDIKEQLFHELILKEKDFRAWIKEADWSTYSKKAVAIYCSNDAIVPTWAYMLIASALTPHTSLLFYCHPTSLPDLLAEHFIQQIDKSEYTDKRVVIKGCGDRTISNHAYVKLSSMLQDEVKSLMFGEPCSTVPVFKKRK